MSVVCTSIHAKIQKSAKNRKFLVPAVPPVSVVHSVFRVLDDANKTHILGIRNMNVDDESESECPVSLWQTMELLEMDIEEIQVNVEHSLEEVYVKNNVYWNCTLLKY